MTQMNNFVTNQLQSHQIEASNHSNRHIIHKFLTAGFQSLTDEELAATLVDAEVLDQDFRQITGGNWQRE